MTLLKEHNDDFIWVSFTKLYAASFKEQAPPLSESLALEEHSRQ